MILDHLERASEGNAPVDVLTPRELQILKLIADAYTSKQRLHKRSILSAQSIAVGGAGLPVRARRPR